MSIPSVSFEFFPPATEKMADNLWRAVERLAPLAPNFVSVTYGAGGSTRDRTHATVKRLKEETALEPAAHLTCVDATREEVDEVIQSYWDTGIRHIVALRGDPPEDAERYNPYPGGYENAAALTSGIRGIGDFHISVAAYPETHPDSPSADADIDMLKRKIDAGAEQAITQFFFEPEYFFRYRDAVTAAGLSIPIIPGIIPVLNLARIVSFAEKCGTTIPEWLRARFAGLEEDAAARKAVAAEVATELCQNLRSGGVDQFHFYTLNQAELTYAICRNLGLKPSMDSETGQ
ncbi:MAG TPA: methylenetetrahydrofolate reductase [NAD(P)H] [Rhodospirillaceae bacterium]|nr:methylenetetrahydrofolate reductase [NAD(P)H] [Rhodospirillaceae bacterium]HAA92223.1 methylenetetrahydrofolate reductase [NAD(P)H] [Rhodospirillaceae bacterium]HAT34377.1 methylenetetrahydrofolate reductase [NAD(P)H] [Rhodospirillaceae bacterium]